MTQSRRSRRRPRKSVAGPAIGLAATVVILIAAVLFVSRLRHRAELAAGEGKGGPAEAAGGPEGPFAARREGKPASPFDAGGEADEPSPFDRARDRTGDRHDPESPFAKRAGDAEADGSSEAPGEEPSEEPGELPKPAPGELTASELWQEAMQSASRGYTRLTHSVEAREQGDPAREEELLREALALFRRALQRTDAWAADVVSRYDPDDLQVTEVRRSRRRWRDQAADVQERLAE